MDKKSVVVKLLRTILKEEQDFGYHYDKEEGGGAGFPDGWTAKDHLAHIAVWKERLGMRLAAASSSETIPTFDGDIDELNREIFIQYRDALWKDVLRMAAQANRDLIEQVQSLTAEQLDSIELLPNQNNRPVWRLVVGNACIHSASLHISRYYLEKGETVLATQLEKGLAALMAEVDDSPEWRGLLVYNLACFQAVTGEKAKAIDLLAEALELIPGMKDYSKQDPDLDAIRQEPGYEALFTE